MTLKNVELVRPGTFAAETGNVTLTAEDMESIAEAYQDKLVDRPVIKLGHDDGNALNSTLGDGEPAFGWVENVALGDGSEERPNTKSVYGDVVGMPPKLEQIAPKAWRRRSVELAHEVKAASGKVYSSVLTHLALLGVKKPAVKGLGDIIALYSEIDTAARVSNIVLMDGLDAAQVSAFSEAVEALAAVSEFDTANIPPAKSADADSGSDDKSTNKETPMPITKADVEKALEQASDDDVTQLLTGLLGKGPDDDGTGDGGNGDEGDQGDEGTQDEQLKTAAGEGAETVVIAKTTLTQLSEGAAAGVAAKAEVDKQRRDGIIRTALSEGRIAPAEQETWRKQLEANEETTVTLLGALSPRFATSEIGNDLGNPVVTELAEADQAAMDKWSDETFGTSLATAKS